MIEKIAYLPSSNIYFRFRGQKFKLWWVIELYIYIFFYQNSPKFFKIIFSHFYFKYNQIN